MKNYSLEELFCEWQKAKPEARAEAMARLRGEGNAVENCSQLDKLYKIVNETNATEHKDILKQLALEFISGHGDAKFEHEETVKFGGRVEVFGYVKPDRCYDYYIQTIAEIPTKCKFYNEIKVLATCIAVEDGEDVLDCKIEDIGLTKKQLAAFVRWIKVWSLDYK